MTANVQAGSLTTLSTTGSSSDVYARMMSNNVQRVIEDVVLVDDNPAAYSAPSATTSAYVCTCGNCGVAELDSDSVMSLDGDVQAQRYIAPRFFVESRTGGDPLVLDEESVAVSGPIIAGYDAENGKLIRDTESGASVDELFQEPMSAGKEVLDFLHSSVPGDDFDPNAFNPFDPAVTKDELLT